MAGGVAEADDGQRAKAVVPAGDATRGGRGSGRGGSDRGRAVRFRPASPSYVHRRRRSGVEAKLVNLDEDEVDEAEKDGTVAGAGKDGAAAGAGKDGSVAGAGKDGSVAGAGQNGVAEDARQDAAVGATQRDHGAE
jgi:hypothetical protein